MTHAVVMETCNELIDLATASRKSRRGKAWAYLRHIECEQPDLFSSVIHKFACTVTQLWTTDELGVLQSNLRDDTSREAVRVIAACDVVRHVAQGGQDIRRAMETTSVSTHGPSVVLALIDLAVEGTEREIAQEGYRGRHRAD
jgi:hypothetical protein